jgi:hypothetical protein
VRDGSLHVTGYLAPIAYLTCVGACLYVLLRHELVLEFSGVELLTTADAADADVREALYAATHWLDRYADANRDKLARLGAFSTAAVVALGVEISLWTLTVTDTLT